MPSWKEIKSRIKSVKNTGKITKAMELISTVKMKKAQEWVLSARPFSVSAMNILRSTLHEEDVFAEFTKRNQDSDRELIIVVASQKWLCGGYNTNVFKKLVEYIRTDCDETRYYDYITIGKRARDFILRTGQNLVMDFSDEMKDPLTQAESRRLVRFVLNEWKSGKYQDVTIIYNHYVSAITQIPVAYKFFPLDQEHMIEFLREIAHQEIGSNNIEEGSYTIEPSPELIIDAVLPMIFDLMFHELLLEAKASEHAARMVAMKNAKDSANKKVAALTLSYNKARQASITKEVSEIVSWVESMKDA